MLVDGCSIRTIERLTDIHRDTVCDVLVTVGNNCQRFMRQKIQNVRITGLQMDELWSYVGCKERTRQRLRLGYEFGDKYCFVGLDRETKLVLAWH